MKFGESGTDGESAEKDELLSMDVVPENSKSDLLVVTSKGFAKRTALNEYRVQKRGGYGVKVMNDEQHGEPGAEGETKETSYLPFYTLWWKRQDRLTGKSLVAFCSLSLAS